MCLNPLTIPNPAKNRYGGQEYIKVSCRNCAECARQIQDDYTCRAIALWNSLPLYYNAYFCTLTFRNSDLPRTNVYRLKPDYTFVTNADNSVSLDKVLTWEVVGNYPCFDHTLYRRFRKSFCQRVMDLFHQPAYMLTTCEYGEKKHRPHYHCIIFVPYFADWRQFKPFIEQYWHYGFTLDKRIACVDGQTYNRDFLNAIEYVTKYVCKYNQWQPFYLNGDFVTDYAPYDVKPRVFCSNGFGAALENVLTYDNYKQNNIYLSIKGDKQSKSRTFNLPSYYRRRKFITTQVISSVTDKYAWSDYLRDSLNNGTPILPYLPKVLHRSVTHRKVVTYRSDDYCKFLYNDYCRALRKKMFDYDQRIKSNDNFRLEVLNMFGNVDFDFVGCYRKELRCYLEVKKVDSSPGSAIAYINNVEFKHCTHYLQPFLNVDYNKNKKEFRKFFRAYQKYIIDKDLPFSDEKVIKSVSFHSLKSLPYSSHHPDFYKLLFMDDFFRDWRSKQIKLKEERDIEWYKIHTLPYQDCA